MASTDIPRRRRMCRPSPLVCCAWRTTPASGSVSAPPAGSGFWISIPPPRFSSVTSSYSPACWLPAPPRRISASLITDRHEDRPGEESRPRKPPHRRRFFPGRQFATPAEPAADPLLPRHLSPGRASLAEVLTRYAGTFPAAAATAEKLRRYRPAASGSRGTAAHSFPAAPKRRHHLRRRLL